MYDKKFFNDPCSRTYFLRPGCMSGEKTDFVVDRRSRPIMDNRHSDDIILDHSSQSLSLSEDGLNLKEVQEDDDGDELIAKKETRAILWLRLAVVVVLVTSIIGVSLAVYSYTKESEQESFENQFQNDATKVLESIGTTLEKAMGAFDVLAVTLVSSAQTLNQTWPFVTMPNFGVHVAKLLPLSKAMYIQLTPLVTPENREQWENYSLQHKDWVDNVIQIQENWKNYYGPNVDKWSAHGIIHGDFGDMPYNLTRSYMPLWQGFPVVPGAGDYPPFNWDFLSSGYTQSIGACMENHTTVLSEAYMIPDPDKPGSAEELEQWALYNKDFIPPNENPMEPVSDLYYPIINDVDSVEVAGAKDYNASEHTFVGMLTASIYWRDLMKDILSANSSSVIVVVTNPCNLPFSYQINGPFVHYLGVGDRHENQYEELVMESPLSNLNAYSARDSEYTGAPLDPYCPFTLHVYPSIEMEQAYVSNDPIIFTAMGVLIFLFTSLVFLLYDFMVERRQKLVMKSAVRTNAIVSSLFPEAVRDRLYPAEQEEGDKKPFSSAKIQRKWKQVEQNKAETNLLGRPIAELYPETTVLFCDIAGFTEWSSKRQPWEVFHLLETIYGEFDKIARRRQVFKVETIGDCYVAVVGLPTPRKNHATVMARFANDCRAKMNEVLVELEEKLGEGTTALALRFGLNSGPTTAGVLRGEKGRFQLFGDTVNTAARMESNSERNRIQVSQSTADLLIADGKGHWLTPRNDLINAKGKGLLQTFWCEPQSKGNLSSALDSSVASLSEYNATDRFEKVDADESGKDETMQPVSAETTLVQL